MKNTKIISILLMLILLSAILILSGCKGEINQFTMTPRYEGKEQLPDKLVQAKFPLL